MIVDFEQREQAIARAREFTLVLLGAIFRKRHVRAQLLRATPENREVRHPPERIVDPAT
jgi:hypothetical protein